MVDIVLNHGSRKSKWFKNFQIIKEKAKIFIFSLNKKYNLLMLLEQDLINFYKKLILKMVLNIYGVRLVHDQIDFDYKNPKSSFNVFKNYKIYNASKVYRFFV